MFTSVVQVSQMAPDPDQLSGWFFHLTTVTMSGEFGVWLQMPISKLGAVVTNIVQALPHCWYAYNSDCSKPQSIVHTYKGSVNQSVAKKLMPSETT